MASSPTQLWSKDGSRQRDAPRRQPRRGDGLRSSASGLSPGHDRGAGRRRRRQAHGRRQGRRRPPSARVPQSAVEAFTRELANLLAGGLAAVARAAPAPPRSVEPRREERLAQIHDDVVGGTSLADALAKWPKAFSPSTSRWSAPARRAGSCDVVLQQIADFRTREQDSRARSKPRWSIRACWPSWPSAC